MNTVLNHQDWPKNEWWKAYNDPELNGLIAKALSDAPDMQIARQRITLAEAQAKAAMAADGPQIDFSADAERQKMSAEGLMGPFAITDPAAGTTGPWYTNGTCPQNGPSSRKILPGRSYDKTHTAPPVPAAGA